MISSPLRGANTTPSPTVEPLTSQQAPTRVAAPCDATCAPIRIGRVLYATSTYDAETQITTSRLAIYVEAPLDQVLRTIDPQSWDDYSPSFPRTELIDEKTGEPLPSPPAPGSAWKGVIFERAENLGARMENHLAFESRPIKDGGVHQIDYVLRRSLGMSILGFRFKTGLDVDEGTIRIERMDHGWKVVGIKRLRFAPSSKFAAKVMNYVSSKATKTFLVNFAEDALRHLARQLTAEEP